jgi:predicted RNA-binding Zn ribbon-like protein
MAGFKFVGGALCLDFVNTVSGRKRGRVTKDKIHTCADLTAWATQAGLVSSRNRRRLTSLSDDAIERARAFREALYRVLLAIAEERRPRPQDVRTVEGEISPFRAAERLMYSGSRFRWVTEDSGDIFQAVAASAAELLTSNDLSRLRRCGGPDCGWLFLDTTRNRSRRWCDMKDCGNLAKVRRYRQRHN